MNPIDFIMHIDEHLTHFIQLYGIWVYGLLFLIVFVETGLVFMPFLPGDNLLFAVGAMAAIGALNGWLAACLLFSAAVLGDSCNFWIGRKYGLKLFKEGRRFPSKKYLIQSQAFFDQHGGKSVFLGRFMPFFRTFTPFVAGMSRMSYPSFVAFSVSGSLVWVGTIVSAGYFFGQLPFVQKNLEFIVFGIIGVSLLPVVIQGIKQYRLNKTNPTM